MFNIENQARKAEIFRQQHLSPKLLVLPNVWDVLSARLVELTGFPSIATASVSTALINGFHDGEKIPFSTLLKQVNIIASAIEVPLTIDLERGYAKNLTQLEENIQALIENGAVGLNIEDGLAKGKDLVGIDEQCRKIELIKQTGSRCGVAVVINARTDIFIRNVYGGENMKKAIERIKSYKNAGADCAYPILLTSYDEIQMLVDETATPLNVLLVKPIGDLKKLEKLGVARVSTGPGFLKAALTKMKNASDGLLNYESSEFFRDEFVSNDFLNSLIKR
jgi:2-methylisocitrate lyase-like PEP mutase family enzyme